MEELRRCTEGRALVDEIGRDRKDHSRDRRRIWTTGMDSKERRVFTRAKYLSYSELLTSAHESYSKTCEGVNRRRTLLLGEAFPPTITLKAHYYPVPEVIAAVED